jgi:hypothetical protein
MREDLRAPVASGPQSGIGGLGALLGLGTTLLAWHAAHSNYRNGYVLADPAKDAHLHTFGWWLLPFGVTLLLASLALVVTGFRRARPQWVLLVTIGLVVLGLGGLVYAVAHYVSLSAVCACDGG